MENKENKELLDTLREKKEHREKRKKEKREKEKQDNSSVYNYFIVKLINTIIDYLPYYIDTLSSEVQAFKNKPIYLYNKLLIYLINNGIVQHSIIYNHFSLKLIDETIKEQTIIMGNIKITLIDVITIDIETKKYMLEILHALLTFLKPYRKITPFEISLEKEKEDSAGEKVDTSWNHIFEPGPISSKRPPIDPSTQSKIPYLDLLKYTHFHYEMNHTNVYELESWLLETE